MYMNCVAYGLDQKDFSCATCAYHRGILELLYYTSDEASDQNSSSTTQ